MLPARSTSPALVNNSVSFLVPQHETNLPDGNYKTQDIETRSEVNSKAEWVANWLLRGTTGRQLPEKEKTNPPGTKTVLDGNKSHIDDSILECNTLRDALLLKAVGAADEECSKTGKSFNNAILPQLSFESLDSSTSGVSHRSFRIGADRGMTPTSEQSLIHECAEKKLLAAGILENCTPLLQRLTSIEGNKNVPLPAPTNPAFGQALSDEDATSMMTAIVASVSLGVEIKDARKTYQITQQRLKTVARRERQLEGLKERRLRESKNPEVEYLQKKNQEMEKAIAAMSAETFQLKRDIREVAIEVGHLRQAERDATVSVKRLHDCRDKYSKVCDENRELNKTIQELQGDVRVFCELSQIPRNEIGYLSSPNRGEVTLQLKQKIKSFNLDAVAIGPPSTSSLKDDVLPILTSVLDGFDATVFTMGTCNWRIGCTDQVGSFVATFACMISTLLAAADSRFYHESYIFEYEILLLTPAECRVIQEKTSLITALANRTQLTETSAWSFDSVQELLLGLLSREDFQNVHQESAHTVLRIAIQRRHKATNTRSTSEVTFVNINPQNKSQWVQDEEVTELVSALMHASSARLKDNMDSESRLMQELQRHTNNHRLYLLLAQLQNEPVYEKTNLAVLNMCNDIIQARTIKDAKSEWNGPGKKKIGQIEKNISEKDKTIVAMEAQREKMGERRDQLDMDLECLRTEIAALQAAKEEKCRAAKKKCCGGTPLNDREVVGYRRLERRQKADVKDSVTTIKKTKTSTAATRSLPGTSKIPLPQTAASTPNLKKMHVLQEDKAVPSKLRMTCKQTKILSMVTENRRPRESNGTTTCNITRDSTNKEEHVRIAGNRGS